MNKNRLIMIVGPTASGKTALAISMAKRYKTEIISADSRQIFKGLDIGTAKPSVDELKQVRHHMIDIVEPNEPYNAGKYEHDALLILDKLFGKSRLAVVAGGSGLYINALCNGFDPIPSSDSAVRNNIQLLYEKEGISYLQETIRKLDPDYYEVVDLANPHRLIRAIEVCTITGKPYSEFRKGKKVQRPFEIVKIGLKPEREKLYQLINSRVEKMMEMGLLDEVRGLMKYKDTQALNTVGYMELIEHIEGKTTIDEAVALIKQHSRNYAKRQLTWFNKDPEINWFDPENPDTIFAYLDGTWS